MPTSTGTWRAEVRSAEGDDERRLNRRVVSDRVICDGVLAGAVHLGTLPLGSSARRRFATQGTDCVAIRWSASPWGSVALPRAEALACPLAFFSRGHDSAGAVYVRRRREGCPAKSTWRAVWPSQHTACPPEPPCGGGGVAGAGAYVTLPA